MTLFVLRRCVVGFVLGLVAVPGFAQDTEIKSVRFRVEPVATPALSVVVENLRDSTLIAWRIEIGRGGHSESNFIGSLPFPSSPGYGPVAPHDSETC